MTDQDYAGLTQLGHHVEPAHPLAIDDPDYIPTFLLRWTSGIAWSIKYWEAKTGQTIGPEDVEASTWALAELGRSHTAADYLRAIEYHQLVTRRIAEWWDGGFDLLLTPTTAEPATPLGTFAPVPDEPVAPIMRSGGSIVVTASIAKDKGIPSSALYSATKGAVRSLVRGFARDLLARNIRVEKDLIDRLFNSSEKRLARTPLLLARYGIQDQPDGVLPKVSQETLAEMIGATLSRVNFFMKKFQRLGFIDYKDGLKVNNSLLTVVLHD